MKKFLVELVKAIVYVAATSLGFITSGCVAEGDIISHLFA